jgi:quinoprotein glucose dehydrogenase
MAGNRRLYPLTFFTAIVFIVVGALLAAGGAYLVALKGSWYYVIAGAAIVLTGLLLLIQRRSALLLFALVLFGSTIWAVFEVHFDFWQLLPRIWIWLLLAIWLLIPWVNRGAHFGPPPTVRAASTPLAAAIVLALLLGVVTYFIDPHDQPGRIDVEVAADANQPDTNAGTGRAPGDWIDYGGSPLAQRYVPLTQITPENARQLKVAWTYRTGDMPGPDDPIETTDENTPLKVGDTIFLCTPHSKVIALDAATGHEKWRFDPQIQSKIGFKHWEHMTCRGVAYYDPAMHGAAAASPAAAPAAASDVTAAASAPMASDVQAASDASASDTAAATPASEPAAPVQTPAQTTALAECPRRLFLPTADARLMALDADTGKPCSSFGKDGAIDLRANIGAFTPGGYYSTSPPAVFQNLVIVGGHVTDNESNNEPSGVIRAFDVNDGHLVWNWDPDNPDATEPIAAGGTYVRNSPNMWSMFSVDEKRGMIYLPMGNQTPDLWGGERTPQAEKFGAGLVALDAATGKVRWNDQFTHHDLWDMDVGGQPTLVDLQTTQGMQPAVIASTKQGSLYVLNRETGKPIVGIKELTAPGGASKGDRTSSTQAVSDLNFNPPRLHEADMWGTTPFDQLWCRIKFKSLRYEGPYTPPSEQGTLVFPGNFGVFDWGGISVDPVRQILIANPDYMAFTTKLIPREKLQDGATSMSETSGIKQARGTPFAYEISAFLSPLGIPCQAPPWGYMAGLDLRTNKIAWMHKNGTVVDSAPLPIPLPLGVPSLGGTIVTAGGVAFLTGTLDQFVRAYDVRDGKKVWEARLPAGGQATPMSYADASGKQYLLVTAGGHGSLGTKAGDYVIAYTLQ